MTEEYEDHIDNIKPCKYRCLPGEARTAILRLLTQVHNSIFPLALNWQCPSHVCKLASIIPASYDINFIVSVLTPYGGCDLVGVTQACLSRLSELFVRHQVLTSARRAGEDPI